MACEDPTLVALVYEPANDSFKLTWASETGDAIGFIVSLQHREDGIWDVKKRARAFKSARKYTFKNAGAADDSYWRGTVQAICANCELSEEVITPVVHVGGEPS